MGNNYTYRLEKPCFKAKQRELGILNCGIRFEGDIGNTGLKQKIKDVACYAPDIGKKLFDMMDRRLICGARVRVWEQAPNENNKISLSKHEKDIEFETCFTL